MSRGKAGGWRANCEGIDIAILYSGLDPGDSLAPPTSLICTPPPKGNPVWPSDLRRHSYPQSELTLLDIPLSSNIQDTPGLRWRKTSHPLPAQGFQNSPFPPTQRWATEDEMVGWHH